MAEHKNSPLKILKHENRKINPIRAPSPKKSSYDEDDEIKSRGYKPIHYILNQRKNVRYVKAINNKGQKIYIEIDVTTYNFQPDGEILDIVTHEHTKHLLDACGGVDCGIVLEGQGIFFIDKNKELYANKIFESESLYPLIKLSQIRQFADKMLEIQNEATKRINKHNLDVMNDNFKHLTKTVTDYYSKVNYIHDTKNIIVHKLKTTLDELHLYQKTWQSDITKNLEDEEIYQLLVYNLELRYQFLNDVKAVIDNMSKFTEKIEKEIENVNGLITILNGKFVDIDKTHEKKD